MNKLYNSLSMVYRFLIVIIFIFLSSQSSEQIGDTLLYHSIGLLIYAFVFSLFNFVKTISYIELVAMLAYIFIMDQPIFYYLLLMPLINFVGLGLKFIENLMVSIVIALFFYLKTGQIWFSIIVFIAVWMVMIIFALKFMQVGGAQREVQKIKKQEYNYKKELLEKQLELENIMKMFVRSKELNEITKEEDLLKALIISSKEFFDAECSVLYLEENGDFVKMGEYGKVKQYETAEILPRQATETDIINEKMMQVVMYMEGKKWAIIRVYGKTTKISTSERVIKLSFSDVDHEVLLTYVDQVIIKLKEIRLQKETEFLANYDFLTNVPNRRYFMDRFDQYKVIADRKGGEFSMILLDIDFFKHFNDKYGHDVGDEVLRQVSAVIKEMVRDKYDIVGRLGGEEFAIILFNPEDKTYEVAERIRRRISRIDAVETITVSMGVVYYEKDGTEWEDLYNKCDKALYAAKQNGRNRVIEYADIAEEN